MKTEVAFVVEGRPEFTSFGEEYQVEGISFSFEGKVLAKVHVIVTHDGQTGHDEILAVARDRIESLLALLHFGRGAPLQLGAVEWQGIEPQSPVRIGLGFVKTQASLIRPIPLPPRNLVIGLDRALVLQLGWYNSGTTALWVIEKIRNYFEVLEVENVVTNGSYGIPATMRWLRNAVSHPVISDPQIKSFLQAHIGTDQIDPNNEKHIQFLESQVECIRKEAQDILARKVAPWW